MQYIVENVRVLILDHMFDCGQCFRWGKTRRRQLYRTGHGQDSKDEHFKDEVLLL